ncbi:GNAT family N-acetyltransferase [Blastococcus sp. TML/M2B]|uniref:GNAT family N-acetyltransferase n=1 Tax=unclassified Blastococcus TaxID=2619396 RepID=UPI001909F7AA|nr:MULTISPECIES: GNAT family N-acetyltransferase [unclassified Blastococcus]MBN1092372.1 GNAT family N-acetyltransferase [Blastococcus sp. TML/M2B]MBN1097535.1 GNAT family N-acetyltransferase [Blastococcus sp. TML/C7B]
MAEISAVRARTVLARAFTDDPLMVWFFPDPDVRPHACAALFGLFAEHYLTEGRVDVLHRPDPVGVAMWRWPAPAPDDAADAGPDELPSMGGLMTALMGPERALEVGTAMGSLTAHRPAEPHAYLHLLGVDPGSWHRGGGGELLERGLTATREAGLVACLDTMNPANVPFYEGHGFAVRAETQLAPDGPTTWSMATG